MIENNIFDGSSGLYGKSRGYIIFRPQVYDVEVKDNFFAMSEETDSPNYAIVYENPDKETLTTKGNVYVGRFDEVL